MDFTTKLVWSLSITRLVEEVDQQRRDRFSTKKPQKNAPRIRSIRLFVLP